MFAFTFLICICLLTCSYSEQILVKQIPGIGVNYKLWKHIYHGGHRSGNPTNELWGADSSPKCKRQLLLYPIILTYYRLWSGPPRSNPTCCGIMPHESCGDKGWKGITFNQKPSREITTLQVAWFWRRQGTLSGRNPLRLQGKLKSMQEERRGKGSWGLWCQRALSALCQWRYWPPLKNYWKPQELPIPIFWPEPLQTLSSLASEWGHRDAKLDSFHSLTPVVPNLNSQKLSSLTKWWY